MTRTSLSERTELEQRRAGLQPPALSFGSERFRPVHALLIILFVASALRLLLVVDGGQRYFPDESRYYDFTNLYC